LKIINVKNKGFNYPVIIGRNLINNLPAELSKKKLSDRVFVIIDSNVYKYYHEVIKKVFSTKTRKIHFLQLPAKEKSKSLSSADKIYKTLMRENFGRDTLLLAIGGGTIGDVGGFVASTYMRGVELVHVPTTLLAAVDSSIGGKTGINLLNVKNIIGTFYQPSLVLVDINFFKSLPEGEITSGTGEIVKYGLISNQDFYNYIYKNLGLLLELNPSVLDKVIFECVKLKIAVISNDLYDTKGLRKILNFGHTFAHAFESYFSFRFNHGKAVTAGLVAALFLSHRKRIINREKLNELLRLPLLLKNKNLISDFNSSEMVDLMRTDKKNKKGVLNFVLIKDFGEMVIDVNAKKNDIIYALDETKEILV
jgi:3-dehydroquinate synthase